MRILLGQSCLFCLSMGKTKHEAARSGFGYRGLLKNQKDKSSYLISLFSTLSHSPPCSTFMMSQFPSAAGLSQSGKVGQNHVHSCSAAAHSEWPDKVPEYPTAFVFTLLWSPGTPPAPRIFSKDVFHSRFLFSLPSSSGEPLVSPIFLSIVPSPCFP